MKIHFGKQQECVHKQAAFSFSLLFIWIKNEYSLFVYLLSIYVSLNKTNLRI